MTGVEQISADLQTMVVRIASVSELIALIEDDKPDLKRRRALKDYRYSIVRLLTKIVLAQKLASRLQERGDSPAALSVAKLFPIRIVEIDSCTPEVEIRAQVDWVNNLAKELATAIEVDLREVFPRQVPRDRAKKLRPI